MTGRCPRKIFMYVTIHRRLHLKTSGHAIPCGLINLRRCLIHRLPKGMRMGCVTKGCVIKGGMIKGGVIKGYMIKGGMTMDNIMKDVTK